MRRAFAALVASALLLAASPAAHGQAQKSARTGVQTAGFSVDGGVALASFMALSDDHLGKLADALETLAGSAAARSADWKQIKTPLAAVAKDNAPAALWFALPSGAYWTVDKGRIKETIADRPYFPRLLAGETVIGELVVSKSTGKCAGIVAVPVLRADKTVAGILGASVYLEKLSAIIREEMGLDDNVIFFTFNATPLLALVWDPHLTMVDPLELGEPVRRAFRTMLSRDQGTVTYTFRNVRRTVAYRRSPLTGWWYAFGKLHRNGAAPPIGARRATRENPRP